MDICIKPTAFWSKPVEKNSKKSAPNSIQFHSIMPVITEDTFMFKASKDPAAMILQILRYSEPLVKLNKSLSDELNQPSFPSKFFSHKSF